MADSVVSVSKDLEKFIKDKLFIKFNSIVPKIKDIIMTGYDELSNLVNDPQSKTNPTLFRDDFVNSLDSFFYIEDTKDTMNLHVPDMDTFDFSGRLKIIQTIFEGVAGTYVEISNEDYMKIFTTGIISSDFIQGQESLRGSVFLVRYNDDIKNIESRLKKLFIKYPFSNMSSFSVLEEGEKFVNDNIDQWVEESIEDVTKSLSKSLKGA